MKNSVIQKDLKQDSPLALATDTHGGATAGSDGSVASASKSKAPGNHANAQIKPQPGSQGTINLGKHNI